jgi:hypothetical protein
MEVGLNVQFRSEFSRESALSRQCLEPFVQQPKDSDATIFGIFA